MRRWYLTTRWDYPIWTVAHRIIQKESMPGGRTRWLVEAPDYVRYLAPSAVQASPAEPDEDVEDRAA